MFHLRGEFYGVMPDVYKRQRYIGPEHLLLGMLRDGEGKAIEILSKLNTNLAEAIHVLRSFLCLHTGNTHQGSSQQ